MHRYPEYTRGRLAQTVGRLRDLVHAERRPFDELLIAGPVGRIGHAEARGLEYRPARMRERLGPLWATYGRRRPCRRHGPEAEST